MYLAPFIAGALLLVGLALLLISRQRWRGAGLPAGALRYSDTGPAGQSPDSLYAARYQLVGRPDYLVERGRVVIPVEVKSSRAPARPFTSHVLQLAAYCLLVEDTHGRPPYGIIRYADQSFEIPYSDELRAEVLRTLAAMRALLDWKREPAETLDERRCLNCGYRAGCGS